MEHVNNTSVVQNIPEQMFLPDYFLLDCANKF